MMTRPAAALLLVFPLCALSCSRILFNQGRSDMPVISARTTDWSHSFNDSLMVIPRGQAMDGGLGDGNKSKVWVSKYGSVVSSVSGWLSKMVSGRTGKPFDVQRDGILDGINEQGFAVHMLYLEGTEYSADPSVPAGVTYWRWTRYLLDTCATVEEAVAAMRDVRIVDVVMRGGAGGAGKSFDLHMAVEDASGDSAIFEVIDGKLVTHHCRSWGCAVMTNEPAFPYQLANLLHYKPFGGKEPLPGDVSSLDRFVRLSYFMRHVPMTHDADNMTGHMWSVINNAAVPFEAPYRSGAHSVYPTWWTSLIDLRQKLYYFKWTSNPNLFWVDLRTLQSAGRLREGAPVLVLDPRNKSLVGEVSGDFSA